MASSSTTLKKGDNLPPRGRAKKTLILEAIREQSLIETSPDSSHEECEKAFFGHIAKRALNPEDQNSAMLIKTLVDKGWASVKPVMESSEFSLDTSKSLDNQASQILNAISKGEIAPDVGNMLIVSITSMLKIKEVTELEERIKQLEDMQDE